MLNQTEIRKSTKKPLIVVGMLLSLSIIGVGGCGASTPTAAPAASTTQSSTAAPAASAASGTQSSSAGQQTQGQHVQNPALRAAMNITRLEKDQQNALTSDQKAKLKPILQDLISTSAPSQDVLQQKADAITAVFTDQQKTFLATPRTPNANKSNTNNPNGNSTNGNNPQGGTGGKQGGVAPKPQDLYQKVLDSLT
ncbi:conserved exported hypothetical protein [Candidatus Desulfosporosinus infrequens]|uniref:Uncharacterized protein n=1 Tax=Candidatus Desulfosporosinus infrequens TaxID=2043169 RepID=A0A2U3KX03_9FIRM|nr:conserved exported hypothetical protein [Candidatus Desulfosporosinus infrequens]